MVRYIAHFTPQAWINDMAVNVDPEGETSWDVTDHLLTMNETQRAAVMVEDDYPSDNLRTLDNAPAWAREWSGPYYVTVEEIED